MIFAWIAWFFIFVSFILICVAGLHYRKAENKRREPTAVLTEKHSSEQVQAPIAA